MNNMTNDGMNFADEVEAAVPEILKIDSENADEFDFDSEDDYSDASFSSVLPAGKYVIRIDGFSVPSAIIIPGVNNGAAVPRARGISATLIWELKTNTQLERKLGSTFYVYTKEGKPSPFGKGQLVTAYAAIKTALEAYDLGTQANNFKKVFASNLKDFTEGRTSQVDLRANSVGTLLVVEVKQRKEREVKQADGTVASYGASNEVDWSRAALVPEAVMDLLANS